jgi:DNA-binding FadR family transcriptional regulator
MEPISLSRSDRPGIGCETYVNSRSSTLLNERLELLIPAGISFDESSRPASLWAREPRTNASAKKRKAQEMNCRQTGRTSPITIYSAKHDLEFHKIILNAAGSRVCGMLLAVVHGSFHKLTERTSQMFG